jgi:hypothetical protein
VSSPTIDGGVGVFAGFDAGIARSADGWRVDP